MILKLILNKEKNMKVSKSMKIALGVVALLPMAMYAADQGDILLGASTAVSSAVKGPIKTMLYGAELVAGVYGYIQTKNIAVLALGLPVVVGITTLAMGYM